MAEARNLSERKKLAQKLRQARNDSHFTQLEVAFKIKKPQSYISKIELGERRIDVTELSFLAKIYKKPLTFFIN